MKPLKVRNIKYVMFLAGLATLSACSLGGPSRPVQYYALSPQAGEPVSPGPGARSALIGVGPVSFPDLFDRPQIVSRPDTYRLVMAEYERWGSSLPQEVQHVLRENLADRLAHVTIFNYPWLSGELPDLQVTVQFFHFDGEPGRQARLSGSWNIMDSQAGCLLEVQRFDISQVTEGPGYEAFVAALSLGLAQLSQEIAGRLALAVPGCQQKVTEPAGTSPESRTD